MIDAGEPRPGAERMLVGARVEVATPAAALLAEEDLHAVRRLNGHQVRLVPVPVPRDKRRAQRRGPLSDGPGRRDVESDGGDGDLATCCASATRS